MKEEKQKINNRELVLSMLMEIYRQQEFSHVLLRSTLDKYDYLETHEKAFIKRLTEGTLERTLELDYLLNQYVKVKGNKMKPFIRVLLRMSLYQLLYMEAIPDSAVCNEAVKLAIAHRFSNLKGFVNGVLRRIAREKDNLVYPQREENILEYFSIRYSMPEWIVEHFLQIYGEDKTETILSALLRGRPLSIRLSETLSLEEQEGLKQNWKKQGITVSQHPYLPYAYSCEGVDGLNHMGGFREGLIGVQDVSSMLVTEAAHIQEGMRILDVCAAPGGKAIHAALKLKGTGMVLARDLSSYKVEFIQENARRQKVSNLICQVWDATCPDPEKEEWADILFCDLPCSGLGVMGRKKEIKYRLRKEGMEELVLLQRRILRQVWYYVKPGGIMIYSTCTINPKENEQQVEWICDQFPFMVVPMKDCLPSLLRKEEGKLGLQLLPGIHETDGFFLSCLKRVDF